MSLMTAGIAPPRPPAIPRPDSLRSLLSQFDTLATKRLHDDLYARGRHAVVAEMQRVMRENARDIFKARSTVDVVDFIEATRTLDTTSSRTAGKFRFHNQEISRGPALAATEPGVNRIACVTSPQMFKTVIIESINAYFAVVDPSSMMVIEPTDPLVRLLVNNKINPMIATVEPMRKSMVKNGLYYKSGPGWYCIYTNAGSDGNLGQHSIRILLCDEIDKWGNTKSGPALPLAIERVSTYGDLSLIVLMCTPTTETGAIWQEWLAGDQRRYWVDCPHCEREQVMEWEVARDGEPEPVRLVRWREDGVGNPIRDSVLYHCAYGDCDKPWSEAQRKEALKRGKWRQCKPFKCTNGCTLPDGQATQDPMQTRSWDHTIYKGVGYATCYQCEERMLDNRKASFHARRFESQRHDLFEMAEKFKSDFDLRPMAWANNMLALPHRANMATELDAGTLLLRQETYTPQSLDPRGFVITAGVDMQADRLAFHVIMWGRNLESWVVDYEEIPGDPMQQHVWTVLDYKLKSNVYRTTNGRTMQIAACAIDTGGSSGKSKGLSHVARRFAAERAGRMVVAIKGASESGAKFADMIEGKAKSGGSIYMVGTRALKDDTWRRLGIHRVGPGFVHFGATVDTRYCEMMTNERRTVDMAGVVKWDKKGRNEVLDTRGYALAAYLLIPILKPGYSHELRADALGIPRVVPEEERWEISERAKAVTSKVLADMDGGRVGVINSEHTAARRKRRMPKFFGA